MIDPTYHAPVAQLVRVTDSSELDLEVQIVYDKTVYNLYVKYMTKSEVRMLNGYRLIYRPDYPGAMINSNWQGYVYEHIYVAEGFLGRPLRENEVVHHLDLDRSNNRSENLLVLEKPQHGKLHAFG